jgi:hypothetical protein
VTPGMTRRILLYDCVVSLTIFAWALLGPWDRILGFSVYRSRGNVWLPTPPAAASFFRSMVSSGSLLFAVFFLLTSVRIFYFKRRGKASDGSTREGLLYQAFYGDARPLFVKYSGVLLVSFLSPFFYNYMWRFHVTRSFRIAGGLAITIALLVVILSTGSLVIRTTPVASRS